MKSRVANAAELLDAVERVCEGGSVIDTELVREMLGARHRTDRLAELTPREREVLALMAEGRSNRGIAQALWISEGAVEKHVRHILRSLIFRARATITAGSSPSSPFSKPADLQQRSIACLPSASFEINPTRRTRPTSSAMSSSSYAETIMTRSVGSVR